MREQYVDDFSVDTQLVFTDVINRLKPILVMQLSEGEFQNIFLWFCSAISIYWVDSLSVIRPPLLVDNF